MLIEQDTFGSRHRSGAVRTPEPPEATTDKPIQKHLAKVDTLLLDRLRDLAREWRETSGTAEPTGTADRSAAAKPDIDLPQQLADVIAAGGKRLRPALSFLGFAVLGGRPGSAAEAQLVKVGAALEFLHTFALVQDDVMDESSTRRGRPTVHVDLARLHRDLGGTGDHNRFGESMAVLLGDLAHAEADRLVSECSADVGHQWHAMVRELVCGQVRDLTGAAWRDVDPEQALQIARLKSGGYTIQRPLELGGAVAGAGEEELSALSEYGRELGTAFALRDDVLGVWGNPEKTGKPAGDDLIAGKPTLIIALAQRRLHGLDALQRVGTPGLTAVDISTLQGALEECGVRSEVEAEIGQRLDRALAALSRLDAKPTPHGREPTDVATTLARFAHQIAWRDK